MKALSDRFWEKVKKTATCWLWTGYTSNFGYGRLSPTVEHPYHQQAHRVSWELHRGTIPAGMNVLHRCDVPGCVRPSHLFLGTMSVNMIDASRKGRIPVSRLNPTRVRAIRRLRRKGLSYRAMAKKLGVDAKTVENVIRKKAWTWVS